MIKQTQFGFWVIEGDTHVSLWCVQEGRLDHDNFLIPYICNYINSGDTVVDGGANLGTHSIAYLRKIGVEGKLFCFEPNPEAFECLTKNVAGVNVFHNKTALGEVAEASCIRVMDNSGASFVDKRTKGYRYEDIYVIPLDNVKELVDNPVDLIKFDLEGLELSALKGAKQIISKWHPKLVLEMNGGALSRQNVNYKDITDFLTSQGYKYSIIQDNCDWDSPQFDILAI